MAMKKEKPDPMRPACTMCGFGIHIEKRPHRFDHLRQDNPDEWRFWMKNEKQAKRIFGTLICPPEKTMPS